MKIKYLEIKNYKQFQNLTLDLTYPKGHKKEGLPLERICIIGQSGTGKTNLLNIIKNSVIDFSQQKPNEYLPFSKFTKEDDSQNSIVSQFVTFNEQEVQTRFTKLTSIIKSKSPFDLQSYEKHYFIRQDKEISIKATNNIQEKISYNQQELENKLIIDDIRNKKGNKEEHDTIIKMLNKKLPRAYTKHLQEQLNETKEIKHKEQNIIDINNLDSYWNILEHNIKEYESTKLEYHNKLAKKLIQDDQYSKENFKQDIQNWENSNENILEQMLKDINSIINKFNLNVKQIDMSKTDFNKLIIEDLSNNVTLNYNDLSTGTKSLISTFIPLKSCAPKESLLLIDEPKISFYPEIQKALMKLYVDIAQNNQLIISTHSSNIASYFEPWEIVELKFDENNQIYRDLYYHGENHVNNYLLNIKAPSSNIILKNNFDEREKKLIAYATLYTKIKEPVTTKEEETEHIKMMKQLDEISKLLDIK